MGYTARRNRAERNDKARSDGHYPYRKVGLDIVGGSPIGLGMRLAHERLTLKRRANEAIPNASVMTRQRRRSAWRATS